MRRGRAVVIGAVIAFGSSAVLPAPASAHGIGGVSDLPIPTWLFAWAAAIVLVASFVALATL
ncbi:MAG TPA: fenitrothion hydrolase, partial [Solirubrobacteraceae bacterium]|nr:fenitrothion hydrolase [Solirubrobacteraceae bacterium]